MCRVVSRSLHVCRRCVLLLLLLLLLLPAGSGETRHGGGGGGGGVTRGRAAAVRLRSERTMLY